jgi:DNA recombination protein RmuC
VRLRIKELAGRQYSGGGRSAIGEVLLFIPNEAISGFIHEHDSALVDDALRQGIVLCSPLTLFALLAVIRQAYDTFMVERTSDEILRLLGAFNTQYERFSGALDLVGKRLESTQRAFDDLNGPRRRQLERPLGKIEELRTEKGLAIDPLTAAGAEVLDLEERRLGELGA